MTVREILLYPQQQAALRQKSEPVRAVNRQLQRLIEDLKDTLTVHTEGIGLAAPQINVHRRVAAVRLGTGRGENAQAGAPLVLINPQIVEARDERPDFDGCLSFPGLYGVTRRPHYLRVVGLDEGGRPFDLVFDDFDAVLVHHELDHLDGVLFIDRIEHVEDLYRIRVDEAGKRVRTPVSSLIE